MCDLVDTLEISQSVVSRHLAYLRTHGLLKSRRDGAWIYYTLNDDRVFLGEVMDVFVKDSKNSDQFINDINKLYEPSNSCC